MKTVSIWRMAGMKVCGRSRTWMETETCRTDKRMEDCPSSWAQSHTRQPITTSNHSVYTRQPNRPRISTKGTKTAAKHYRMCRPPSYEHPGAVGTPVRISWDQVQGCYSHMACATFSKAKQPLRTRNLSSGTGHLTLVSQWCWNYPTFWVKTPSWKCKSAFQ